jgi:chemotaxis response regulator CheB
LAKKTAGRLPVGGAAAVVSPALKALADGVSSPGVVGVGASAGGLEAFTELLNHLPNDTGMAFVLIQHLDPKHESHLTELLSKGSKMPVSEVKSETRIEAAPMQSGHLRWSPANSSPAG